MKEDGAGTDGFPSFSTGGTLRLNTTHTLPSGLNIMLQRIMHGNAFSGFAVTWHIFIYMFKMMPNSRDSLIEPRTVHIYVWK